MKPNVNQNRFTRWPGQDNQAPYIAGPAASPLEIITKPPHMSVALRTITEEHQTVLSMGKPWKHYQPFLHIELGGPAILAYRKKPDRQVVAVKEFQGTTEEARVLLGNQHKNIVHCYEGYHLHDKFFLIEECMDVTLLEVIACTWDLREDQIAAVCLEVLNGIKFLKSLNLVHEELKPQNILLSIDGAIKIGNFSHCRGRRPDQSSLDVCDIESLGRLAMEMMDRNVFVVAGLSGNAPSLQNPERWTAEAKNFITATSWASADGGLANHRFLVKVASCSSLIPHIRLAMATVRREWKVPPMSA